MTSTQKPPTAPGPRSYSPLGNLRDIQRDPLRAFTDVASRFGDVVRFRAGILSFYLVTHPDHVKRVLQDNHQNYRKGFTYRFIKPVVGLGLLTSEGEFWRSQRRMAQPAFHRQRLESFAAVMTDAAESMLDRWRTQGEQGPAVDVSSEMTRLTLEIVGRTLLSNDVSDTDAVGHAVTILLEHVNYRSTTLLTLPEIFPTPRNLRFKRALRTLDTVVYDMIEERRRSGRDTGDLLSMLLLTRDEETGEGMSDKQVRDEVMTIFIAGHETTATVLAWTWYLLSAHPEVEGRLHDELAQVLDGRPPTFEDLPHLKYTRMVIEESLRLYPPVWSVGRAAIADDEIGGYRVPANAQVVLSPYVTHRHRAFWEDPERFDPERFTPERVAERPRYAYFPFSGGPRQCIGNEFAMMEAQLILATVAKTYRLRLIPGHPVEPEPMLTLRPRQGVLMDVYKR